MKVLVCGKGGSGKSTLSALLAKKMAQKEQRILLVDVDESNIGLYRMLGLEMPVPLMDYFGGKKGFQNRIKTAGVGLGSGPTLFPQKMGIEQFPEKCVARVSNVHAVSVGKIHHFGEGCACPMGRLFKMLFASLVLKDSDKVIVDTSAGVEHFGRSLDNQCDHLISVIDPSYESVVLARKILSFAKEINLPVSFVINKLTEDIEDELISTLAPIPIAGKIYADPEIFVRTLKGESLNFDIPGLDNLLTAIGC